MQLTNIRNFNYHCPCLLLSLLLLLYSLGWSEETNLKFEPYELHFVPLDTSLYQVALDVEDPCFEFLSGDWNLSYSGSYHGYYYFTVDGPGTGESRGRWIAEGLPAGSYLVEFWANYGDYASDARYRVVSADGVSTVTVNMNYISSGWHTLGSFNIDRVCVVEVSDYWTGVGTQLSVDALRFTLISTLPTAPESEVVPHIGVCIDDCGSVDPTQSYQPIYKMLRLPFKMTFAVMPGRTYTTETANEITKYGSEVILHQPMAAISVPNPGTGGIRDDMTLDEVRSVVSANLDALPHVAGMNNHMGSLITQREDKMQVCIEELKKRDLYFYDSRTYTLSVAYDVAKQHGLLTGERDLFIDGNSKEESMELIRSLAERALYAPHIPHLAIGHVRSSTADALVEIAPELEAMGVEIWPISKCISHVIETDYAPSGTAVQTVGNWIQDSADVMSKQLLHDYSIYVENPAGTQTDSITFRPDLPYGGLYDIYAAWRHDPLSANHVQVQITHFYGVSLQFIDQSQPLLDWLYLGRYRCSAGSNSSVTFNDYLQTDPGMVFRGDALKYVFIEDEEFASFGGWYLY